MSIFVCVFIYWSFANENALEIKNQPFPVRTIRNHTAPNGVVILSVDYCKNTKAVGRVRTSFVSSTREVLLPVSEDKQGKGCVKTEVPILVPKDITPDTYKIKFYTTYKVNPFKTVTSEFESKEFIVD